MKWCKKCGEELEDTAKFCSKCGVPQTEKTKEADAAVNNRASSKTAAATQAPQKKSVPSKPSSKNKKEVFNPNMPIRQFFLLTRKEEYTEKTAEKVKIFLEAKKIVDLLPIAIITIKELGSLYQQWEQAKKEAEDDTMSFAELGKLQKKLKNREDKLLTQFEKAIENLKEKEEQKKEGKKKFNAFNEKKQKIYERLKESSPNDGSCDDKDCGYNNCLALAMKIAAGKDDFDSCPYIENDDDDDTGNFFLGNISPAFAIINKLIGRR